MSSIVSQLVTEARQTAHGAAVLEDWLGKGGQPISRGHAECRAVVCVKCPMNVEANWWHRFLKDPIARAIRSHISLKNQIGLTVSVEKEMAMCRICGCATKLKVWVPIEHIKAHHKLEHDYPDNCWVKSEMEQT